MNFDEFLEKSINRLIRHLLVELTFVRLAISKVKLAEVARLLSAGERRPDELHTITQFKFEFQNS